MTLLEITTNEWYIASIVTGILFVIVSFLTFVIPHKKTTLIFRLSFDILLALNCICIYFATGVEAILVSLVCGSLSIIRDIVFYFKKKGNIIDKLYWPIGFNIIYALSLIWTWSGVVTLLPVLGNIINTTALYIHKKRVTRIVTLIGQLFFIVYSAILLPSSDLLSIFNLISGVGMFVSAFIGLVVLFIRDNKRKKESETIKS